MGNDYYILMTDTRSNNLCGSNICVRSKFITIILDTTYCIMSVFDRKHLISLSFALNGYFSCREMFIPQRFTKLLTVCMSWLYFCLGYPLRNYKLGKQSSPRIVLKCYAQ